MVLEVKNIAKFYGNHLAVDHISFTLKKGEITGFLGVNGAGKSTTMKMLTGVVFPSEGSVYVNGESFDASSVLQKRRIGYLSENNPLYPDMYVREYLDFMGQISKVNVDIATTIEMTGLTRYAHKKIRELSKGYKQRVGLAAAILHQPEILILDEPTTGLDPNQIIEIRQIIKQLSQHKIILMSSHIMQEVQAVCDRVIILHQGKIILDEYVSNLHSKNQVIEVAFDYRVEERLLRELPHIVSVENKYEFFYEIVFDSKEDQRSKLFDFAIQNGLKILQINYKNRNLEHIFYSLTQQ